MNIAVEKLAVFYSDRLNAPDLNPDTPSASKPKQVVDDWFDHQLNINVLPPCPLSRGDLEKAHRPQFVRGVLECTRKNGFGNRDPETAATLPFVSGAMFDAAAYALSHKTVAVAPVVGFHHADWDKATRFCTFNGLVIAAVKLLEEYAVSKVGILDFDHHRGDGTNALIQRLHLEDRVHHFSAGYHYGWPSDRDVFFRDLPDILSEFRNVDIVLFKAGADPHESDPKGGWLSTEDLQRRDKAVFQFFGRANIPVAWDLGGGYGAMDTVLEIHRNSALAASDALSLY